MEVDADSVRKLIAPALEGVDEPILEYLATLIAEEEGGPTRPLRDEVGPFLMSAGIDGIDDEDAGNALCDRLEILLRAEFATGTSAAVEAGSGAKGTGNGYVSGAAEGATATLLDAPLNLREATEVTQKMGWGDVYGQSDAKVGNAVWEAKDLGKAKKERKALRALANLQAKMAAEPEQQMSQLTRMVIPSYEDRGSAVRDIAVDKISLWTPSGAVLLEDSKMKLTYGRRYGLMGKNGIGKTTLLKAIAAQELEGFPKHLRCLHVSQEAGTSEKSVVEAVVEADAELQLLLASQKEITERLETIENDSKEGLDETARLAEVHERLDEIDAKTADSRARALLAGLQFSEEMQAAPLSSMSGGWRVRAAIAAALFIKPEVLMLDEPTNHLDLEAVLWLQHHLQTYPHTVLVVSHDRAFLNEVATDILHIENRKLLAFKGDFNTFEKTRKELLRNQIKEWERYQAERKHMQEFIDSFRYNAKRASLVQSRIKALEKLEAEAPPEPVDAVPFTFSIPNPDSAPGRALVQLESCGFEYPARDGVRPKKVFSNVNFSIDSGEKIGVVGPNGAGKSTMLKLLLGELSATSGSLSKKPGVLVSSFTQHHADKLDLMLSPIENLLQTWPKTLEADARSFIGQYGVQGAMQATPLRDMSGGQKSRVAFAMLAFAKPNLIVMDEPTNHLDMETIEALADAVASYTGGVVVVSHDQFFIEKVCREMWVVSDGKVAKYSKGHFQEYKKEVLKALNV